MLHNTLIKKDLSAKKLRVERAFDAPVEKVWRSWTERNLLDQWWAPKPWKAETKTLDFRAGGVWLYAMVGPDGTKTWCRVDFHTIDLGKRFTSTAVFADGEGNIDPSAPPMHWLVEFEATATGSRVIVGLSFDSETDMTKMVEMGFEGGFTMGLGNLDELLTRGI